MKRILLALLTALVSTSSVAQERVDDLPLPPGVPPLTEGTVISSGNANEFKGIIVPELFPLVSSGTFPLQASPRLEHEWSFDAQWEERRNPPPLLPDGRFAERTVLQRGFPFGSYSEISKESELAGHKVLWNIHAHGWSHPFFSSQFRLFWFHDKEERYAMRGELHRAYPRALDPETKNDQLFREKLLIREPAPLSGLAWLTFRFVGADEDRVWVYSPAIKKVRQVTSQNRSDGFAGSGLAPDDLFTWSGKVEGIDASAPKKVIGLVPFPSLQQGKLLPVMSAEGAPLPCIEGVHAQAAKWNFEERRFLGAADSVPSSSIFVPRELLRIELHPRDFYSVYGRQILYVDAETMVPVYKVVYDRAGTLLKIVVSAFSPASSPDESSKYIVPVYTLALYPKAKRAYAASFESFRSCTTLPPGVALSLFDPHKLP